MFSSCVQDALEDVLRFIQIENSALALVGSSLNIFLGHGPDDTEIGDLKSLEMEKYLVLIVNAFIEANNKDYVTTALMISLKVAENEQSRKELRKAFLSKKNEK